MTVPPHLAALERWRAGLAGGAPGPVPRFDPSDGGDRARVLILLETPAAGMTGADAVSRDSGTRTARNLVRFLDAAGLARADTLLWNAVPWVLPAAGERCRPPRRAELAAGLATLPGLLALLPRLRAVVLAGRAAAAAAPVVAAHRPGLPVLPMPHPSPTIVCTSPAVGAAIAAALAQAAALLG